MSENDGVDYGPLKGLIGTWSGDKGIDIAPEPGGVEENPYFETILFEAAGDVTNAEEQTLGVVRYHQVVRRKSDGDVFHDQVGYWMWDAATGTLMYSLAIPRGVAVLAGGTWAESGPLDVAASLDHPHWSIVQSPFMTEKAKTTAFALRIDVEGDRLSYSQTTTLEIYGRTFEHTDENGLIRQQD
jgi:hypothetical protein